MIPEKVLQISDMIYKKRKNRRRSPPDRDGRLGCTADFSAGCRFRLLINGAFAEDGPVEAGDYSHMWSASPACWMRKKDFFRE